MRRTSLYTRTATAAIALAACCPAAPAQVLMYSLEGGLQGFTANGGGTTIAADTVGATDGTGSMRFTQVAGATFTGALTSTLLPPVFPADPNLSHVMFDLTIPDGGQFGGAFAVIGLTIFGASQPDFPGGQLFGLQWQAAQFSHIGNRAPGTYTITLGPLTGTNQVDFSTNQTFGQTFGPGPNQQIPTGFQLFINKSADAPLTVYIDNIRAVVPEPASLAATGIGALALLRRHRSRQS